METLSEDDVLPRFCEIPAQTLGFLNELGFKSFEDLSNVCDLALELSNKCAHLETHLQNLHRSLGSSIVSWASRSIRAKSSLEDFILNLENLSLISSQDESRTQGGRTIQKIMARDLPYIVNELWRIECLREYAVIALKLEALVGDLEDGVLSVLNHRSGHIFSRTGRSPSIPGDYSVKLENVHRAVKAINNIEELLLNVQNLHPHWSNLLKAVDTRVDKILGVLRPQVIADHRSLLASLGWPPKLLSSDMQTEEAAGVPNPLVLMQGEKKQSYSQSFLALCALQHVQFKREGRKHFDLGQKDGNVALWAIDELVSPIASRIEHHLLKWTDKPEFMFALVYKITRDFIEGVDDVLQPLIDRGRLVSCSAKEAWVSAMVQVLSGFLAKKVFPVLAKRYKDKNSKSDVISSWLYLIDHSVKFDKRMQLLISSETDLFFGEAGTHLGFAKSMSVLSLFCERLDWLKIWAKVELKDAWKKLKAELTDERSWSAEKRRGIGQRMERGSEQYFLSTREDHKAPVIAEFALKISWEMIERCRTLPGTSCRVQFIRSAVAKFLWHFFKVLLSRHKSAEFPACDSEETLVRICQLINVARYSEFTLREWSDNIDLLELSLAEKGLNIDSRDDTTNSSCFFEEEIQSLVEMETNWIMEVITQVLREFENLSFYYFNNGDRFELPSSNQEARMDLIISDDFAEALDNLRRRLLLIKEHLNATDFLDVWRSVAEGLDHFTFRSILSIGIQFSEEGAKQYVADMQGLFLVFRDFCDRPEAFFPFIKDLVKLLELGKDEVLDLKSNLLSNTNGSGYLLSFGISKFSVDQAWMILNDMKILV